MTGSPGWHHRDAVELAGEHGVDPTRGLDASDVAHRIARHGANELTGKEASSWLTLLADQFKDFMVLVLIAAAVVSGAIGELIDTLAIVVIVVLNAVIGFVQAWRADKAMAALQQLAAAHATVLRDGEVRQIPAAGLVPGDIVLLEAGNQVPADLRLIDLAQFRVDESALTGESVTVEKHTAPMTGVVHALGDRLNMAFKGTTATHGRARGLVVAIGMSTELGKVARLNTLGELAAGMAVAAIPEALPAVVTVLLALGARKMVSFNALIRRLPSVETLGSVSFICSDKTGTLTQNRMHAEVLLADGESWQPGEPSPKPVHQELLRAAALCNDATHTLKGGWAGDPTETALTQVAGDAGLHKPTLEQDAQRVLEFPFDAERKRMTTFHRTPDGLVAYTKGAPEAVLAQCTSQWQPGGESPLRRAEVLGAAEKLATQGLRVLALARRSYEQLPGTGELEAVESGLCLIGLIGLIDPPRPEAAVAVRDCISAGITPVMITGDHPATARAIAQRLGILSGAESDVLTGVDLAALNDAALRERVRTVRVYARVDPLQKIRIVEALQAHGEFVAMTGDGVNDAPALKQADIGVAMGRGGTDVAREASSLVLLDDNFATIVAAVREGRRIYDNIRKFVRYAMTGNSGEIWTIFLAPLMGLPIPLLPIHILWINLVTDGLPGLALAAEPAERGVMQRPPRPPSESLFSHGMWQHILAIGLLLGGLCLAVQAWALSTGHSHGQTMVFTVLTLGQMAHVMAIRSEFDSLWRQGLLSNKPLLGAVLATFALQMAVIYVPVFNTVFKTAPLSAMELGICLAAAMVVFIAVEAEKTWRRSRASTLNQVAS